jgi:hypothetical protein
MSKRGQRLAPGECRLTPRSSGAPTACHQAPATGTVYIFCGRGLASYRRDPLSSNVSRHNSIATHFLMKTPSNSRIQHLASVLLSALLVLQTAACSTRSKVPLPAARLVCVQASMETAEETAYLMRRMTETLREYGFALAESGCEVTAKYQRFGGFQAEQVSPGILGLFAAGRSGYWSQEGILSLEYAGSTIVQDQKVNLRGYRAKQDLIDALAWEISGWVSERFQPPTSK